METTEVIPPTLFATSSCLVTWRIRAIGCDVAWPCCAPRKVTKRAAAGWSKTKKNTCFLLAFQKLISKTMCFELVLVS